MDETPETKRCECGSTMIRRTQATRLTFRGLESEEFEQPGFYCQTCGEGVVTGKDMRVSDKVLAGLKAQVVAEAETVP